MKAQNTSGHHSINHQIQFCELELIFCNKRQNFFSWPVTGLWSTQVIGRIFAPSQKLKKLTQQFRLCFELPMGILNVLYKIFWVVYGPILKLQGFECVRFQGKNCVTKTVSNFSEINSGLTKPKKMNKNYQ